MAAEINIKDRIYTENSCDAHTEERSPVYSAAKYEKLNAPIKNKRFSHREELLIKEDEELSILNGYNFSLSYVSSKGPRRRKRIIHCKHPNCSKEFIKAWNFLDHARMHLGEKPFQ
jgi:hypothetical protein